MSFFSLLFYALLALSISVLALIVKSAMTGKRQTAWIAIRVYLIIVAVYATFLVATMLALPIRILSARDAQYSGDWSIAVAGVRRHPHDSEEDYEIDFRVGNRGAKTIHGEKNLVTYLLTENGTRYDPVPEPSWPPFDVPVMPGKWVTTTRRFILPANQNRLELVIAREGLRAGWFIIGRTPFDGRTVIRLR